MDRGAWQAIVHGVVKSGTRLSTHSKIRSTQIIPLLPYNNHESNTRAGRRSCGQL